MAWAAGMVLVAVMSGGAAYAAAAPATFNCTKVDRADGGFALDCTIPVAPTPSTSPTATPSPSTTTNPSTPTPSPTGTSGPARLRGVDGGLGWYGQWGGGLPTADTFFPIGVWFESVLSQGDVDKDKQAGLNTYVELTNNTNFTLARNNGMFIISDQHSNANLHGHLLDDEADMVYGPAGADRLRQQALSLPNDNKMAYTNVGKGVLFWQSDTDAARFMNLTDRYGRPVLMSYDTYWMTDLDACQASQGGHLLGLNRDLTGPECQLAANYGRSIDRLRALDAGHDPVWGFVEVGRPGTTAPRAITPAETRAATWSTLIHGARGVIYFNHSFSGPCQTQHALRESCYAAQRAMVTTTNQQITRMAPVLNAPFADNVFTVSGLTDASVKWYDGHFYVLAGANTASGSLTTFRAPCVGDATVTVLDENRTIPMTGGAFVDGFADGNAVHLYRIDGGGRCGL